MTSHRAPLAVLAVVVSIALALAVALPLRPAPARAAAPVVFDWSGAVGADGVPAPWKFSRWAPTLGLPGDWEATARVLSDGGRRVLHVRSVNAGFIVGLQAKHDISATPHATWQWKAETLPTGASFRQRGTNDQALQILFGFEGGKVVGYIWDSTGTVGATGSGLSWREDVRVVVLQAGAARLGQWVTERRDLAADFRTLFGEEPPVLGGVAVQCNSQHTVSTGSGFVGTIALEP